LGGLPSEFVSSLAQLDNASSAKAAIVTKLVLISSPSGAAHSSRALCSVLLHEIVVEVCIGRLVLELLLHFLIKRTRHF
jgi:hypothetical protein